MTTIAPKPDWALALWKDERKNLYVQLGDQVLRFDYTEAALSKVLKLVPAIESQPGYVSGRQNIADHILRKPIKLAKATERKRLLRKLSPERRERLAQARIRSGIKESK